MVSSTVNMSHPINERGCIELHRNGKAPVSNPLQRETANWAGFEAIRIHNYSTRFDGADSTTATIARFPPTRTPSRHYIFTAVREEVLDTLRNKLLGWQDTTLWEIPGLTKTT